jgi:hypothetical protein
MWDLWWTKWHWGRFSPSTSVSPANSHSPNAPQHHHISSGAGTVGQTVAAVPTKWTQSHPMRKINNGDDFIHSDSKLLWGFPWPIILKQEIRKFKSFLFSLALQPQFRPWPTFMKLSVSLQFSRS